MESKGLVLLITGGIWWWWLMRVAISDPQTNLLNEGCSTYNASSVSNFYSNLNATLSDLKTQLNDNKHFATAERTRTGDSVYAMVQCRNYMSTKDCVACFTAAQSLIRNCSAANGARVIYDGCFLRYESSSFYDQATLPGNAAICGNQTASQVTAFQAAVEGLLADLEVATPRIDDFYVAYKKEVVGGGGATVYGMAQCAETVSPSACRECLKVANGNINSCLPSTYGRAVDAGCFLRYSNTPFFADNQTTNITPFLEKGGSSKKKAIIGGVAGGVGLLLLISVLFLWYQQSRKAKAAPRGDILGATELRGPVNYSYRDLKAATKNFSAENKLGEGGFGDVYKGTLKNGKMVAVKRLFIGQPNRVKADFESEVKLISNIHHRNLIRLLGCCGKRSELLLVYEYMANSSLDKFLFGERRGALNWKQRLDIIAGTARGLAYLHEEFHVCIIHRDIKSSNILLDNDFQPKIADFGLARLLPEDKSHLSTKFAGTLGYTSPEYAIHGQLSEKVDTYSYGIVVLEIISGRKCNEMKAEPVGEYLLERAWKLYEDDKHLELVDESLDPEEYKAEEVKKIIEIALMCAQSSVSMRPTMSEVVVLLRSKGSLEHGPPTRPTFVESSKRNPGDTSISTGSSASNATASISHFSGR
ncbi:cold-responsive protein kinase 1-like isoform X1 [Vitis riparia]|uniref:cold-responsive protein kinase 1-like isoform X1 n=1 Tax=Vitis riparia TaxID=96939 RepID=UPI00155B0611|nr:cold-responsive protein kinase 1-like isoform X1 [Vitis riparia]